METDPGSVVSGQHGGADAATITSGEEALPSGISLRQTELEPVLGSESADLPFAAGPTLELFHAAASAELPPAAGDALELFTADTETEVLPPTQESKGCRPVQWRCRQSCDHCLLPRWSCEIQIQ